MPVSDPAAEAKRLVRQLAQYATDVLPDGATLTEHGRAHARNGVTTGLEELRAIVDEPTWKIVTVLNDTMAKQPHTRETLAGELGIHPNGGRYGTNLARLREMGVIPERGGIHLTAMAFE